MIIRTIASVSIASITAGVWMSFGAGAALITFGAIVYLDIYMPTPGGNAGD